MSAEPPIVSPCVKVCWLDAGSGLCLGCLRTAEEIAGWVAMGAVARARVLAELPGRAERIGPAGPPAG